MPERLRTVDVKLPENLTMTISKSGTIGAVGTTQSDVVVNGSPERATVTISVWFNGSADGNSKAAYDVYQKIKDDEKTEAKGGIGAALSARLAAIVKDATS